jgi:DNA-binding beta-propeller fold protein YncE
MVVPPPAIDRTARNRVYRRRRIAAVLVGVVVVSVGLRAAPLLAGGDKRRHQPTSVAHARAVASVGHSLDPPGFLAPGSDPSVLPGPVLVADKANNRLVEISPNGTLLWEFPRPGDLRAGETFNVPDDAFFTPDGRQILATQEDDFVVSLIDIATHRLVWRYGVPGVAGSHPGHLWNPDDAIMLRDGRVVVADIKNCRILFLAPGRNTPDAQWGRASHCRHAPPTRFGSPNGAFPTTDGSLLVTEITHDWVSAIDANGAVLWSTHPPGVSYPSDTNMIAKDKFVTVDYSHPGKIVEFDHLGRLLWKYRPTGADTLNKPSLAFALPNGDIFATDDDNNRVIVVDPKTNRVVWQYGHTGTTGTAPGYLSDPDGADLAPPNSLMTPQP